MTWMQVEAWDPVNGVGSLDSAETPGGCWFTFAAVVGALELSVGNRVWVDYVAAPWAPGFAYAATSVAASPELRSPTTDLDRSRLTIAWDDE